MPTATASLRLTAAASNRFPTVPRRQWLSLVQQWSHSQRRIVEQERISASRTSGGCISETTDEKNVTKAEVLRELVERGWSTTSSNVRTSRISRRPVIWRPRPIRLGRSRDTARPFSLVLEHMLANAAAQLTDASEILTIGIGAGPNCNRQVLVLNNVIVLSDQASPSAKQSGDV